MTKILRVLAALAVAACASGQPEAAELPPPCPADVAARTHAGSTITPPVADSMTIPPSLPGTDFVRIDLTIGVDGRVVQGKTRVTGTADPRAVRRLTAWAASLRFRPATVEGCAIVSETSLQVSME